jgi:hypothetical protein
MAQAIYFLTTGIWPLVSMRTFEKVTGPKVDEWLVRMVGLLAATIGVGLSVGARRDPRAPEIRTMGLLSALSFGAVDIYYVLRRRISPVYLLDAVAEGVFIAAWMRERVRP